ncbi:MAG: hypothetical protein ACOC41_08030 [Chitinivibrionales bacterium]
MSHHSLHRPLKVLSAVLACAFLFASCTDDNPLDTALHRTDQVSATGEAVVYLPQIPDDFLAKTNRLMPRSLTLIISGPDMDTIRYEWPIGGIPAEPFVITDIPAGYPRVFEGTLTNSNGTVTHSGEVAVTIEAGMTVNVHLRLNIVQTDGSASVCIEVEGLPSSCAPDTTWDTITRCFTIYSDSVNGVEPLYGFISLGSIGDSAYGDLILMSPDDSMYFKYPMIGFVDRQGGSWAHPSSVYYLWWEGDNGFIHGEFNVSDVFDGFLMAEVGSWFFMSDVYGNYIDCSLLPDADSIPPDVPPDTIDTTRLCMSFDGSMQRPGTEFSGSLRLTMIGSDVYGVLDLEDYPGFSTQRSVGGSVSRQGGVSSYHLETIDSTDGSYGIIIQDQASRIRGDIFTISDSTESHYFQGDSYLCAF